VKIVDIEKHPFYTLGYKSSGKGGKPQDCTLPFFKVYVDKMPEGVSSFVVASDLQGREKGKANRLLGEVVSEELAYLSELGELPPIAGIMLTGDLYDYPECHKRGGSGDVTSVWNAFHDDFGQVIGVHGNHDMVDNDLLCDDVIILDGNTHDFLGLKVGGVSGIVGSVNRNQRKTEEDFMKALQKVNKDDVDILLLHQGPDALDGRIGDPLIRQQFEQKGNALVAFGHCPWDDFYAEQGEHQVLNVDGKVMLLVEGNS